ncbi:hypothetical protein BH24ACT2_BH24ACT2_04620 [soil metagenome]
MADPGVDAVLARVAAAVTAAEKVALACHVHPDGDALGSVFAFHLLCRAHGVASVASWGEPFTVAPHYRFLPGLDQASSPSAFPDRPELMVTFDCGSLARLGELAAPAGQADELVVLDHHHDNARYGSINVVDTGAASTATVVRRLAEVLGWDLDYEVAFDLYVGLLTDTGRFQYPNTTSEVFTLAQELAGHGLPLGVITRSCSRSTASPTSAWPLHRWPGPRSTAGTGWWRHRSPPRTWRPTASTSTRPRG